MQCCVCVHCPMCCAALKNHNPSPPNPYISEMAFSCRFQKVYTYPPPQVTTCLHAEAKVAETTEKCQNPQSWQVLNVPERYAHVLMFIAVLLIYPQGESAQGTEGRSAAEQEGLQQGTGRGLQQGSLLTLIRLLFMRCCNSGNQPAILFRVAPRGHGSQPLFLLQFLPPPMSHLLQTLWDCLPWPEKRHM